MTQRLSYIRLDVDMEGRAWGGFITEQARSAVYGADTFKPWPGLKKAVADLCSDWGDVESDSVRPFEVNVQFCLCDGDWTRWVTKQFYGDDLIRLGLVQ